MTFLIFHHLWPVDWHQTQNNCGKRLRTYHKVFRRDKMYPVLKKKEQHRTLFEVLLHRVRSPTDRRYLSWPTRVSVRNTTTLSYYLERDPPKIETNLLPTYSSPTSFLEKHPVKRSLGVKLSRSFAGLDNYTKLKVIQ